jgi:sulfite exporter TauE/SafE/copper chaperone CopZ
MSERYIFHVNGMHCKACVILIEDEIGAVPGVSRVKADLAKRAVTVEGDFGENSPEKIAALLTQPIKKSGYALSVESQKKNDDVIGEFLIAFPIALSILLVFFLLQKAGLVHLVGGGTTGLGTAFIVGIIASLSTCMAVVGGLLLSMSATYAKENSGIRPHIFFHTGRLVAFFVLGGVIGTLGTAFTLSSSATFVLGMLIGFVMLVLGINLLDIFHGAKRLQLSMPQFIGKRILGLTKGGNSFTPFFVGVATFFLPCGFTQSMQLYTLSTGGFLSGAMTMFVFALGTLPVLALISFGSTHISKVRSGIFYKTAGLIVIAFALINIFGSLAAIGIIHPILDI